MNKTLVIGISGGSASGKTSISKAIFDYFDGLKSVVIIRQDDYYKDQSHLTMEERLQKNYDHPFEFDNDLLISDLKKLSSKQAISKPLYDFKQYTRSNDTEVLHPCDVIILEGLFVLEDKRLRSLLDIKIYVDTDADVRFIRRVKRDVFERGRTLESVISQYLLTVKPMHETFIEPSKRYADIIIPEGGSNLVAIDLLTTKINSIINNNVI